ncbi:MAG: TonB-dependent receptor, partial [Bacteroidota bacterium]|nr:TonB-dependent receptor [Bacteroidota bacterium]
SRRFEWFPAVSGGWRFDREKFFPVSESIINLCKVRGSYGELGNTESLADYGYMSTMLRNNYTYSFANTKVTGSALSSYVNTSIRWEKKKTLDFGADLAFYNSQLEFTFDWYKATSVDLHYGVPVPPSAGFDNTTVYMNASTMVNSGLEFLLSYHNRKNVFKYDVSANLSTLKNKVTNLGVLGNTYTTAFTQSEVGREVGSFYGYVSEGLYNSQSEIDNRVNSKGAHITQDGAQLGDVKYADLNNDGKITDLDRTYLGSGIPKVNFGLNLRAEYKGFDLSVSTYGAAGFKAVDFVDMTLHSSYGALNKSIDLLNAWTPENTNTSVPRVAYKSTGSITNDLFSNRYIQNASYLKIANVELGYNFPDKWFGGYMNGLRIYASAQNLATLTKYKGYNVDFAGGTYTPGYNYCSYPTPQTVMFGVHASF